jgi:hypothetical protein
MNVVINGAQHLMKEFPKTMDQLKTFVEDQHQSGSTNMSSHAYSIQKIDWDELTCCYQDSEEDINTISGDEDIRDAFQYSKKLGEQPFACIVIDRS